MMTPYGATVDGLERQLGVNHVAHAYLCELLLPALKRGGSKHWRSRIIAVSSMMHTSATTRKPEGFDAEQFRYSEENRSKYDRATGFFLFLFGKKSN